MLSIKDEPVTLKRSAVLVSPSHSQQDGSSKEWVNQDAQPVNDIGRDRLVLKVTLCELAGPCQSSSDETKKCSLSAK